MKEKEKKGLKNIIGMLEMDYEGIQSLEPEPLEKENNEEIEIANVDEFNKEENNHFNETFKEFEVKCNLVTLEVDNEEGEKELVDEPANELYIRGNADNNSASYMKSCFIPSESNSMIKFSTIDNNLEKFRKNPMHREPPRNLHKNIGMHNHHTKNPLFRTFTIEENTKLEEQKKKEMEKELINQRLSVYQILASDRSNCNNIEETKKLSTQKVV